MIRLIITSLSSLLFPGIGQILNGQWLKGFAFAIVELGILYFIVPNTWIIILFRAIWLLAVIDTVLVAFRAYKGQMKSKGLMGLNMIGGVVVSIMILIFGWLPNFMPNIMYYYAAKSDEIIEEEVPEGQFKDEQEDYKNFLEDKYDESFTLGEGSYNDRYGHYIIDAHPEDDEDILFIVHQDENDEYHDTYIRQKWTKEANSHFDSFIHDIYEDVWDYDLEIKFKSGVDEIILEENDQIPSFSEGVTLHPDEYSYVLQLYVFKDIDDQELDRMYDVITKLHEDDIQINHFEIEYYDEELLAKEGKEAERSVTEHKDYRSYFITMGENEIDEIDSPSDLEQYVKDLR